MDLKSRPNPETPKPFASTSRESILGNAPTSAPGSRISEEAPGHLSCLCIKSFLPGRPVTSSPTWSALTLQKRLARPSKRRSGIALHCWRTMLAFYGAGRPRGISALWLEQTPQSPSEPTLLHEIALLVDNWIISLGLWAWAILSDGTPSGS